MCFLTNLNEFIDAAHCGGRKNLDNPQANYSDSCGRGSTIFIFSTISTSKVQNNYFLNNINLVHYCIKF